MGGELLLHLDVADAIGECGDDGLIRHLGDLEANVVEALDVLLEGLSWLLLDAAQVTRGRRAVASALEVGDEAVTHLAQEEIEPGGSFRSHERAPSLRAIGNQFAMTFSSPLGALMLSS